MWIFPGEDPDEKAKQLHVPPPPTTPKPTDSQPEQAPKEEGPMDPLAAMMAPPSRAPSSMKRPGGISSATPGRLPPGMMMPPGSGMKAQGANAGGTSAPPQYAVFTPKPTPKGDD